MRLRRLNVVIGTLTLLEAFIVVWKVFFLVHVIVLEQSLAVLAFSHLFALRSAASLSSNIRRTFALSVWVCICTWLLLYASFLRPTCCCAFATATFVGGTSWLRRVSLRFFIRFLRSIVSADSPVRPHVSLPVIWMICDCLWFFGWPYRRSFWFTCRCSSMRTASSFLLQNTLTYQGWMVVRKHKRRRLVVRAPGSTTWMLTRVVNISRICQSILRLGFPWFL